MDEKNKDYNLLKVNDIIWVIYFFLVLGNLYSNYMQEENVKNNNSFDKKNIRSLNLTILVVVFTIYIYFVIKSYNDVLWAYKNNKPYKRRG